MYVIFLMTIIRSCYNIVVMKRVRYDYMSLIVQNDLMKEFKHYCFHHPKIKSKRRLARNFLLALGFRKSDFMTATLIASNIQEAIRIAKTKWLD